MFVIDPLIVFRRAFRRSRVRIEIILVLFEHGRQSLNDLARLVGAHPMNVRCALAGDGRRYRVQDSLVMLGLVGAVIVDGVEVYELTALGEASARGLRAQVERRRGPRVVLRT